MRVSFRPARSPASNRSVRRGRGTSSLRSGGTKSLVVNKGGDKDHLTRLVSVLIIPYRSSESSHHTFPYVRVDRAPEQCYTALRQSCTDCAVGCVPYGVPRRSWHVIIDASSSARCVHRRVVDEEALHSPGTLHRLQDVRARLRGRTLRQPKPSGGHDRVAPTAHPHLRRSHARLSLRDPEATHDLPPLRSRAVHRRVHPPGHAPRLPRRSDQRRRETRVHRLRHVHHDLPLRHDRPRGRAR